MNQHLVVLVSMVAAFRTYMGARLLDRRSHSYGHYGVRRCQGFERLVLCMLPVDDDGGKAHVYVSVLPCGAGHAVFDQSVRMAEYSAALARRPVARPWTGTHIMTNVMARCVNLICSSLTSFQSFVTLYAMLWYGGVFALACTIRANTCTAMTQFHNLFPFARRA